MTTTLCACSGEPQAIRNSAAAKLRMKRVSRWENVVVMIIFAKSTDWDHPPGFVFQRRAGALLLYTTSSATRRGRTDKGPQTDMKHKSVTQHGRRGAGRVVVGGEIVGSQDEAVVHVT